VVESVSSIQQKKSQRKGKTRLEAMKAINIEEANLLETGEI
jgi:hypothetical protein